MSDPLVADEQHGVVFYKDDHQFLCEAIIDFCIRAIRAGDPLVVIATTEHLAAMREKLREHGVSWPELLLAGRGAEYDADKLLDEFSVDASPDAKLFRTVMERVMAPWRDLPDGFTVRAFGEMVDLLCRRGQPEEAIRLVDCPSHF